ncbi:hypothetical protein BJ166DRAFT_5907 [Pestalotiopsis sp. NC0098]|nr:hypothetical protein BJ166DRAFT_5907 [Pestalotiopsis sp. NC0098]
MSFKRISSPPPSRVRRKKKPRTCRPFFQHIRTRPAPPRRPTLFSFPPSCYSCSSSLSSFPSPALSPPRRLMYLTLRPSRPPPTCCCCFWPVQHASCPSPPPSSRLRVASPPPWSFFSSPSAERRISFFCLSSCGSFGVAKPPLGLLFFSTEYMVLFPFPKLVKLRLVGVV